MRERLELPAAFCGELSYKDSDGDEIPLRTDVDVKEARLLCSSSGKPVYMTLRTFVPAGADCKEEASSSPQPHDATPPVVEKTDTEKPQH